LAQARAATDAAIAETIDEAHEKLAADKHAQAEASERAAKTSAKEIATARGKGNRAKAAVEEARDDALSTANQAHAQAGEELGQLDAALGDADDQMVKLKEKDAEDSHDEILDRETAWEDYEKELLTFTAVEAGHAADSTESTWGEWLKWVIPFWGTLSGWSESFDRRAAERDRFAAVIARGDFDSVYAMQQARVNALGGVVEGLYHASALQAEVGTEVVMAGFGGLSGAADDAFRSSTDSVLDHATAQE
ncbi:MAG: hypothetical protein R6U98_21835, partial [Pirellulaceae bacterium]